MVVTVETTDTVKVVDVVKTDPRAPFVLTETWNPDELRLRDYSVEPFLPGVVFTGTGQLRWDVPPEHPKVITLTKWFHVEPCDWPFTILEETLAGVIEDEPLRPVRFEKKLPILDIGADYYPEIVAGDLALFTLVYSNTGGYENDVLIRNEFPDAAPYVTSDPPANRVGPERLWAEWDIPVLSGGSVGNTIDVEVAIDPSLPPSTTIEIWDWIYDHTGRKADRVRIELHVQESQFLIFLPVVMRNYRSTLAGAVAWVEASEAVTRGMSVHDVLEQEAAPPPLSLPIYASRGRIFPR
jgi:hypothetical protein